MKVFVLGAPCAGKTSLVAALRARDRPALDMDEELLRRNGGTWPALAVKRPLSRGVIDDASLLDEVALAYSIIDDENLATLRAAGWVICLLELPEAELRARARQRLATEGWTNIEWLPSHLANIEHLRAQGAFAHTLDARQPSTVLAATVAGLMR